MTSTGTRNALRIAARQMRDTRRRLGLELRTLREDAGLSLRAVARSAGVDHAHLLRVERGDVNADAETLAAIAAVLGADLSMRLFPQTGPLLRDHIQARITDALLEGLDRRWERHLEVLVRRPSRGVIDVVLRDAPAGVLVAVEVQSDLRRLEQQIRWLHEKAAGLIESDLCRPPATEPCRIGRVLVLRSSQGTREIARTYGRLLATAYPARSAAIHASLTGSEPWPGDGIVWASVHGTRTRLLAGPPPGVPLGR